MLIKEFIQVFRDKRTRFVLLVPPLVQMMVFGYAATFEIRNIPTAVLDLDASQESRELVARFASSRYFQIRDTLQHHDQMADRIDRGRVAVAIQIHPGFAQRLRKGETAPVQVILDGTNSNTALIAVGYIQRIAGQFAEEYQRNRLERLAPLLIAQIPRVELEARPWFNADLKSRWFFVPGVIGSLTLIMVVLLTAFSIVREREIGTLEQIMVTPIRRWEFILGKTLPFFLIGLADASLIALVGTLWFEVPFRGDLSVLFAGTVLFLGSMLGVGLFISTVSSTQQQAMVSAFFFNMPAITFSGFGFPIASIPENLRWITYFDPLRYFLVILRGVYLKGVSLDVLWPQFLAMALIGLVLLTVSVFRFRKSLE
jgi:ABC-2 type transport system permease protein